MEKLIVHILILMIFSSCEVNNKDDTLEKLDFEFLQGTWVENESLEMRFLDFFSETQARFGHYGKQFEMYDSFNYRIIDNQIGIEFLSDNEFIETFHDLRKVNNETIEISDLTDIPENSLKTYLRREILKERKNDTIIIGHNQIYYDFEHDFQLKMDSVLSDYRCPIGLLCYWTGNARVKFDLIIGGKLHIIQLDTYPYKQTDTLIQNIKFKLDSLMPYPVGLQSINYKDYIAKILTEKQ